MQSVIFDLDGTLLDTLGDLADACNHALRALGFPVHPENAYRRFVGNGARLLCLRILPEQARDEETLQQARSLFDERYRAHMFDRTAPYSGVPELLLLLRKQGLKLGVVSNKPEEFVQSIAERYFPGLFDGVTGQRGGITKPDPAGLNELLARFAVSPGQALYVGDSEVDIQTAHNARVHSCGAVWGFRGRDELAEAGAEFLAETPGEVAPLALL